MSKPLVVLVGLIYAGIAVQQLFKGNIAIGCVFAAYAACNIPYYFLVE